MPDVPLFEPTVLNGVVEKMTAPESLTWVNRLPRTPHPFPVATWDVIKGSRAVAKPNVPNSEAHIVPRLGISQESASFIYLREKKVFSPTTLHWLRAPGSISNLQNAEQAVMREVRDLNQRFDNFVEWCSWQALTGTVTLDYADVQATIDYKMPSSHKPNVGTTWASATPAQMIADVTAWKRLVSRDGKVKAGEAYTTDPTLARVVSAFAAAGNGTLLSDRSKDKYYESGELPGFLQLDWKTVDSTYDTDAGVSTLFLGDDTIILGNFTENRPFEIYEGPTADDEAPDGHTGKYAKTWKEKDPSARQYLLEYHFLPVITRPEQIVYVADVAP
jgi:hypothetical protein